MIYVRALALGCFYSYNYYYRHLSEGADRVAGQLRGDKEYPFSGVTKSGRVWRKVPESDVRSVCSCIFFHKFVSRHIASSLWARCAWQSRQELSEITFASSMCLSQSLSLTETEDTIKWAWRG